MSQSAPQPIHGGSLCGQQFGGASLRTSSMSRSNSDGKTGKSVVVLLIASADQFAFTMPNVIYLKIGGVLCYKVGRFAGEWGKLRGDPAEEGRPPRDRNTRSQTGVVIPNCSDALRK